VGRSLKLAQRAWCLEQGIEEIRWTYDPMLVRNARLNISRLGGYGSGLLRDFYGEMSDLQNAGDRSDRFELRWRLLSPRVLGALAEPTTSEPGLEGQVLLQARQDGSPVLVEGHPGERALVKVPADYASLRRTAPDEAATWREVAATAFASCFAAGLVAAAVSKNGEYLFVPRSEVEGTDSLHSP
jgi:predicted GNAT superfamily acetyltransferase